MKAKSPSLTDNALLIVAVIAVVVSIVGAGITYSYISNFRNKMTGFATSGGWINLTVESSVSINFTTNSINWSNGSVASGKDVAFLDTSNQTEANVTDGSWIGHHVGLIVENIGNKNVSLALKSSNDNSSINGTAGDGPLLRWKITSNDTSLSCNFSANGLVNDTWTDVNISGTSGTPICNYFYFEDNRDKLKIDFFLRIPSDSVTGNIGSTITATFNEA